VKQDEPVDDAGDGSTCPDAWMSSTGSVSLRAERAGTGNGRVYAISFVASDGHGGSCTGTVSVCVPHDKGQHSRCVDDGQRFDSLAACSVPRPTPSPVPTPRPIVQRPTKPQAPKVDEGKVKAR
jgi:hypothetical protein